ncbi:hypothetical protein PoB_001252700 [Plakobranchus ocellatus]|uniref:Uncharacterized protein n=1 Tax=Plakobranchus ocellatus TaxID=259542 RepID=A0AAV3YU79_9GAST|nr:hypothetical protein PoB_001252700 [Plakobranchus ocellatus]
MKQGPQVSCREAPGSSANSGHLFQLGQDLGLADQQGLQYQVQAFWRSPEQMPMESLYRYVHESLVRIDAHGGLETVTIPPREVRQYKLQHYCCDGADKCEEAENIHTGTFDTTNAKFLAVVLGSTAACVVLVIIIFAITFYTKKSRCVVCDQASHAYTSAGECSDGEDSRDDCPVEDKPYPGEERPAGGRSGRDRRVCWESDSDRPEPKLAGEAVYAEIGDPTEAQLPRYADIFKDGDGDNADEGTMVKSSARETAANANPFSHASAPPMYTEVIKTPKSAGGVSEVARCTGGYANAPSAVSATTNLRSASDSVCKRDDPEIQVIQPSVHKPRRSSDNAYRSQGKQDAKMKPHRVQIKEEPRSQNDPTYYNVRDKKKKKRRASSGGNSAAQSGQQAAPHVLQDSTTSSSKPKGNSRRNKSGNVAEKDMELTFSKSCSASEGIVKSGSESSETSLNKSQKRRSAPPGSAMYQNQNPSHAPIHSQTPPMPPQSAAPPRRSSTGCSTTVTNSGTSNNPCGVIYEAQAPANSTEKEKKNKNVRKENLPLDSSIATNSADAASTTASDPSKAPSPHNYENARLVAILHNSAGDSNSSASCGLSIHCSNSNDANNRTSSGNKNTRSESPAQSTTTKVDQESTLTDAAVLTLSQDTHFSGLASSDAAPSFSLSNSESAGSLSGAKANSSTFEQSSTVHGRKEAAHVEQRDPAGAYDKLQFDDSTKPSNGRSNSPNAHVYQSLETVEPSVPNTLTACDRNSKTEMVSDRSNFESPDDELSDQSAQSAESSSDCVTPLPLLPPRCPINANKQHAIGDLFT